MEQPQDALTALRDAIVRAERAMADDTSEPQFCVVSNRTVSEIIHAVDVLTRAGVLPASAGPPAAVSYEPAVSLTVDQLPWDVAEIVGNVADFIGVPIDELFVADHTHEGLRPGAYSIAYEGDYDWPIRFCGAIHVGRVPTAAGRFLECGAGWRLDVYPDSEPLTRPLRRP